MPAMSERLTSRATRVLRLARVGLHLARGVATAGLLYPFMSTARRREEVERWSGGLLAILAVKLEVSGGLPRAAAQPLMIVANHVLWLDIIAIDAVLPVRFVAKSEVRAWPLIGWLCAQAGTLFIERAWLAFLPPLENRGQHRRELAHAAHEAIARSLFPPARDNRTETAGGLRAAAR